MIVRLGNVLYWGFAGLAAILAAIGAFVALTTNGPDRIVIVSVLAGVAVVAWLVGRACLYVIAGR